MANSSTLNSYLALELVKSSIEDAINILPLWLLVVESVVLVCAVCTNLLVLYTGLSKKSTRGSTFYLLLLNHTFANLLLSALVYPSIVFKLRVGLSRNQLEVEHCRYSTFSMLWFLTVGLLTNGYVALNRALSCHPLLAISAVLRSRRTTAIVVVAFWIIGFTVYIVPAHAYERSWFTIYGCLTMDGILQDLAKGVAIFQYEPVKYVVFWGFSTTLIVTMLFNVISYATIARYLVQKHGQGSSSGSDSRRKEKRRALVVIVLLFLTLLVCWLPFLFAFLLDPGLITENFTFLFLPALESLLDPLLYLSTMPAFRPKWAWCRLKGSNRTIRPERTGYTCSTVMGNEVTTTMTRIG